METCKKALEEEQEVLEQAKACLLYTSLVEATGSLWSSVLMHVIFNAQSVLLMYFYQHFMPEVWLQQTQAAVTCLLYTSRCV